MQTILSKTTFGRQVFSVRNTAVGVHGFVSCLGGIMAPIIALYLPTIQVKTKIRFHFDQFKNNHIQELFSILFLSTRTYAKTENPNMIID